MGKGHCVVLYDDIIDSKAWKEISGNAVKVYIQLMRKRYIRYEGKGRYKRAVNDNAKNLSITIDEAKKLWGMDKRTLKKAIDELIEKGFIDLIEHGFTKMSRTTLIRQKKPNIYGLSERFREYGKKSINSS